VRDILSRAEGFLYPKDLAVTRVVQKKRKQKLPKGNGGWGDQRDRRLCTKLSQQDVTADGDQQLQQLLSNKTA
jgi:alpha-1,6-mannosyl-glycoprotein beta-1,2-N-acetylglucosaminyltransferase